MPEQDGYDLLRLLRTEEALHDLPVIAATGYVGSREQEQMATAGFAASLSKPFDLNELLDTLERVCGCRGNGSVSPPASDQRFASAEEREEHSRGKHENAEEFRLIAAVVSALVPGPAETRVPGILA